MPFAILAASPARYFRAPLRFAVVTGFGTALLAAAGLEHAQRSITGRSARGALSAGSALGVLLAIGVHLSDDGLVQIRAARLDAPIYDRVGVTVRRLGEGPLAEMPGRQYAALRFDGERRVGSTRHWLPSVLEYTGYPSEHTALVQGLLLRLPDADALADLVDMTHLRWLLLRPREEWGPVDGTREGFLATLLARGDVSQVVDVDGWKLARLGREPQHPEWFAAIAAPRHPGVTVLGTPLEKLRASAAVGRVAVEAPPAEAAPGKAMSIRVSVTNLGDVAWPVSVPMVLVRDGGTYEVRPERHAVVLRAHWRARDGDRPAAGAQTIVLRRDVLPAETLHDEIAPIAPARPGRYSLALALEQIGGTRLSGPGGAAARLSVVVR